MDVPDTFCKHSFAGELQQFLQSNSLIEAQIERFFVNVMNKVAYVVSIYRLKHSCNIVLQICHVFRVYEAQLFFVRFAVQVDRILLVEQNPFHVSP